MKRFQEKQAIVVSGSPETTGFGQVGPRTISKLNELTAEEMGVQKEEISSPPIAVVEKWIEPIANIHITTATTSVSATSSPAVSTSTAVVSIPPISQSSSGSGGVNVLSTPAVTTHTTPATIEPAVTTSSTSTNSDTVSPGVSVTAPVAGATVSGTIAFSVTASDNAGLIGVQFKLDGTNLGTEVTATSSTSFAYSVSWNSNSVADGSHTLTATARDAAGNTATSPAVTITVTTPPPPPTSELDIAVSGFSGLSPTVTEGATLSVQLLVWNPTCRFCEHTTPATTVKGYFTPWYPNDGPQYTESGVRYGEQTFSVPPIIQWTTVKIPWSGTATPAGHYYFVAIVDPDNTLQETNEDDNKARSEFYIQ